MEENRSEETRPQETKIKENIIENTGATEMYRQVVETDPRLKKRGVPVFQLNDSPKMVYRSAKTMKKMRKRSKVMIIIAVCFIVVIALGIVFRSNLIDFYDSHYLYVPSADRAQAKKDAVVAKKLAVETIKKKYGKDCTIIKDRAFVDYKYSNYLPGFIVWTKTDDGEEIKVDVSIGDETFRTTVKDNYQINEFFKDFSRCFKSEIKVPGSSEIDIDQDYLMLESKYEPEDKDSLKCILDWYYSNKTHDQLKTRVYSSQMKYNMQEKHEEEIQEAFGDHPIDIAMFDFDSDESEYSNTDVPKFWYAYERDSIDVERESGEYSQFNDTDYTGWTEKDTAKARKMAVNTLKKKYGIECKVDDDRASVDYRNGEYFDTWGISCETEDGKDIYVEVCPESGHVADDYQEDELWNDMERCLIAEIGMPKSSEIHIAQRYRNNAVRRDVLESKYAPKDKNSLKGILDWYYSNDGINDGKSPLIFKVTIYSSEMNYNLQDRYEKRIQEAFGKYPVDIAVIGTVDEYYNSEANAYEYDKPIQAYYYEKEDINDEKVSGEYKRFDITEYGLPMLRKNGHL